MNNSRTLVITKKPNTPLYKKKNTYESYNNNSHDKHSHDKHSHDKHKHENKIITAKSIFPQMIQNDITPMIIDNPFMITLPSAIGLVLEVGDMVIISSQTSKFSTNVVSVFIKLTEELSVSTHLIGVVQSIDAHNLINASFGGLINYPDGLIPATNYYLCNSILTENKFNGQQQLNRFMGTATSTNKILWMPENLH
jgi:hypothetical protein